MTSPFDWKGKPSIIAKDRAFRSLNGKSQSQHSTQGLQKVYAKGINSGTILGVTDKVEAGLSESFNRIHRRKK